MIRFSIVFLIFVACISQAEVYKWVDAEGVTHYSDKKPESEKIVVETMMASPLQIDNKGKVKSPKLQKKPKLQPEPNQQPNPQQTQSVVQAEQKPKSFLDSLLAVMASVFGVSDDSVIKPTEDKLPPDAITNENMDEVLEQIEKEKTEKLAANDVEIFTAPWCGYCKMALAYLDANKIPYTEHDVSANPAAALRQKHLGGGSGIPFAVINGQKIQGWNRQVYAKALGL